MFTVLARVDPEEDMNRWYLVTVQRTLLEPIAVVCAWGSRQTTWQQVRVIPARSWEEAEAMAVKIVRDKCKRGYVVQEEL